MNFENLESKIITIVKIQDLTRDEKLKNICQLLHDNVTYYNWVGYYFANHETRTLH